MAGIQVAVAAAVDPGAGAHNRRHRRCRGVDLQRAGRVGHRARGDNPVWLRDEKRCSGRAVGELFAPK